MYAGKIGRLKGETSKFSLKFKKGSKYEDYRFNRWYR